MPLGATLAARAPVAGLRLRARRAVGAITSTSESSRLPPAAVWVTLIALAATLLVDALIRHESGISGDERFYERMAQHPGGPHNFPYAYRVGVPWLVHILPFGHAASFTALACISIALAAGAMYMVVRTFVSHWWLAAGLALGFALSPTLTAVLPRHGRSVDPEVVLIVTLGTLFILRRSRVALGLTLLVGTTIHESCLFLIPFAYAAWATKPFDSRALRDVLAVALAPAALYAYIRTSIDAVGKQYVPGYVGPFLTTRFHVLKHGLSGAVGRQQIRRLALAYGPLWLCAPAGFVRNSFARRGLVLIALGVVSMTFAYGWQRIIFFAAPVFYVAAATPLKDRPRLAAIAVLALLAFDLAYIVYLQVYAVQHGIDPTISSSSKVPVY
jgi:hypothetical protein